MGWVVGFEESFDEVGLSGIGGVEGLSGDQSTDVGQAMAITMAILARRGTADMRRHRPMNLRRQLTPRPDQDPETHSKGRVSDLERGCACTGRPAAPRPRTLAGADHC